MTCFAICGDSGTGKTTMSRVLASYLPNSTVLECDRYHKWERGDPHWGEFTHLSPEANELDLMNQDVQSLKSGEAIYRRDYDHNTGRFTEKRKISPAQNIITCGLHTLRCPDDLYDIRVFMDTDPLLKAQWKIARDTSSRGYTVDEVRQQIDIRQKDFIAFVEPLMSEADLVVNFRNEEGMSPTDSVKGWGRHLRIFVKDRHGVDGMVEKFRGLGIDHNRLQKSQRRGFHQINIDHFKPTQNYYYDYVAICVLDILKCMN